MDKDGNLNARERELLRDLQRQAVDIGHVIISNAEYGRMREQGNTAAMLVSSLNRSRVPEHPA
jgi:hypothetical protein